MCFTWNVRSRSVYPNKSLIVFAFVLLFFAFCNETHINSACHCSDITQVLYLLELDCSELLWLGRCWKDAQLFWFFSDYAITENGTIYWSLITRFVEWIFINRSLSCPNFDKFVCDRFLNLWSAIRNMYWWSWS